jgi:very-short-patch-repair endonuclease
MTDAERKLWYALRARRFAGFGFRRQAPIGPYVADFVCHGARLIVEVDGGQHAAATRSEKDEIRSRWLAARGYGVIRFWNNDVLTNLDGVLAEIGRSLASARPSKGDLQ